MHAATLARRTPFGDFSEGSGRRQCRCIARSTGERCRRDAVQGVTACQSHGGLAGAITTARKRDPAFRRASNTTAAREALAAMALAGLAAGTVGEPGDGLAAIGRRLLCRRI
jgi:hypothetical protein